MKLSLKSLYSYKIDIISVKNMYYTESFHSDNSYNNALSIQKLVERLSRLIVITKELQLSLSKVFYLHEVTLTELKSEINIDSIDSFDFELCMKTVDDILNNINYRIKTLEAEKQGINPAQIEQYWEDNYSLYYKNMDGFDFEVRYTMYDLKYGIDYTVFTDYYDRENENRYFIATVVPLDDENVLLFPVFPEEKEHYLKDIKIFDDELFDEVDEILDYFDFYY